MKFFFPDSMDLVDPSFDFHAETRSPDRVRQRDDLYAHEVFSVPPYDGLLVSKAIVDGIDAKSGKYTIAQRERLLRSGVRAFLRLDDRDSTKDLEVLGDCGAFSYIDEPTPSFSTSEVLEFYDLCGFDLGVSVDHVIPAFTDERNAVLPGLGELQHEWKDRQELTLELAADFFSEHKANNCRFHPVGVAQGWSPSSYAHSFSQLEKIGYDYIALGGLVPLKTPQILAALEGVNAVRSTYTRIHLFGVTRCEKVRTFAQYGVTSFDSTSPLRRAFKDSRENYYTPERSYTAIRVPQIDGNAKLRRLISSGQVDQEAARLAERNALDCLRGYSQREVGLDETVEAVIAYESFLHSTRARTAHYRETLESRPWEQCKCEVCAALGIDVVLFRGAERNRRRGFHNVFVFEQGLRKTIDSETSPR